MDIVDEANEEADRFRLLALRRQLSKPLPITGACYYCGEPVGGLFCDIDCAKDYELEQRIRR